MLTKKRLQTLSLISSFLVCNPALGKSTVPFIVGPGPCDQLASACSKLVGAQTNQIAGLEDALKKSRAETDGALKRQENNTGTSAFTTVILITVGLALGAVVGASVAK